MVFVHFFPLGWIKYFQVKLSELQGPLLRVPVFGDF